MIVAALDEDQIGIQAPAQEDVLRIFEEVSQQGVLEGGAGLGVRGGAAGLLRLDGEDGEGVALGPQVQVQLFGGLIDLLDRQLSGHDALEEGAAGVLLVLLGLLVELGHIAVGGPLPLDFLPHLAEDAQEGVFGNRLKEVALHADLDGLPGVFKVVVAGDNNDLHLRKFLADQLAEGESVHKRHTDISNEHVRAGLPDQGEGHFAVPGLPGEGVAVLGPRDSVPQGLPDDALILH